MSTSEVGRFVSDLRSDPDLLAEVREKSGGLGSLVDFAKGKGYDVTVDEAKAYIQTETERELSDEQLDAVAGGKHHHHTVKTTTTVVTQTVEAAETVTTVSSTAEVATVRVVGAVVVLI